MSRTAANPSVTSTQYRHKSVHKFMKSETVRKVIRDRWIYFILLPGLLYFIIFKYVPMWGVLIAFKDYNGFLGFMGSKWVGLKHFQRFFAEPAFWMLFKNTLYMSVYNLLFYFPIPIILALMLNEIRKVKFKRIIQTMIYVPHFMSWVVVVGITYVMFTTEGGIINGLIESMGGEKVNFLLSEHTFRPMYIGQIIWKEAGWGTIIFLAALTGVDIQLYEASYIDGANRWQQLVSITLPSIQSTIVTMLILRMGNFLDTGFEHIFLMLNSMNRNVGEVFDTYVYQVGVLQGNFSYSTAVGLFKSVIGLILVAMSNWIAKKAGEEGIY